MYASLNEPKKGFVSRVPGSLTAVILLALSFVAFILLQPPDLEDMTERLHGRMAATGFVVDADGVVRLSFKATVHGIPSNSGLVITEIISVSGAETRRKHWTLSYDAPIMIDGQLDVRLSRRQGDAIRGIWSLLPHAAKRGGDYVATRGISNAWIEGGRLEVRFTPITSRRAA